MRQGRFRALPRPVPMPAPGARLIARQAPRPAISPSRHISGLCTHNTVNVWQTLAVCGLRLGPQMRRRPVASLAIRTERREVTGADRS